MLLNLVIISLLGSSVACLPNSSIRKSFASESCAGKCGDGYDPSLVCQCNDACGSHHNCCDDYQDVCSDNAGTCVGRCGSSFDSSKPCQCNDVCNGHNDCCTDFEDTCNNGEGTVTVQEMLQFGETVFGLETNNAGDLISLNYGCKTSFGNQQDCSPDNLFESVDSSVMQKPIYQKLQALYDNYERSVTQGEDHTEQEQAEEEDFLKAVMDTEIMQVTFEFLTDKGIFKGDYSAFEAKLKILWFKMYERSSGKMSSSGFEHVFIGEVKNGDVSGFHNWFRWYTEEKAGNMNYLGYWKSADIGQNQGSGIEYTYKWDGVLKPYGSMFIGTSPELEMSLYTACLLAFPNEYCHVTLGGTDVWIQTWEEIVNGVLMVGSSYPDFAKP